MSYLCHIKFFSIWPLSARREMIRVSIGTLDHKLFLHIRAFWGLLCCHFEKKSIEKSLLKSKNFEKTMIWLYFFSEKFWPLMPFSNSTDLKSNFFCKFHMKSFIFRNNLATFRKNLTSVLAMKFSKMLL